ncbi:MAG: hypothetical protein K2M37_00220, partial [Muribaculaceae bacterium]|nr:hypothetical protein [Muribaculaceae bacterium]
MNRKTAKGIAAAFAATILLCPTLCSCEGRTMNNMTPRGETVEVNPLPPPGPRGRYKTHSPPDPTRQRKDES